MPEFHRTFIVPIIQFIIVHAMYYKERIGTNVSAELVNKCLADIGIKDE